MYCMDDLVKAAETSYANKKKPESRSFFAMLVARVSSLLRLAKAESVN